MTDKDRVREQLKRLPLTDVHLAEAEEGLKLVSDREARVIAVDLKNALDGIQWAEETDLNRWSREEVIEIDAGLNRNLDRLFALLDRLLA